MDERLWEPIPIFWVLILLKCNTFQQCLKQHHRGGTRLSITTHCLEVLFVFCILQDVSHGGFDWATFGMRATLVAVTVL